MSFQELVELARQQHGVVALRQATGLGIDGRTLQRRLDQGWERVQRGVYALPGSRPTLARDCMAEVLAAGTSAAVGAWTAANLWGFAQVRARPITLLIPHGEHRPALRGVQVRQSVRLDPEHITQLHGVRLTVPARTLCDLASTCRPDALAELAATAVQQRLVTLDAIDQMRLLLGQRPGSGRIERVVAQLRSQGPTDSRLERDVRRLLHQHGFRPAPGVYPLRLPDGSVVRLDIAFPSARLAIEVDGFAWHGTPEQLQRDHERQNRIQAADWLLFRVSARDLARPERFLAVLAHALRERERQM